MILLFSLFIVIGIIIVIMGGNLLMFYNDLNGFIPIVFGSIIVGLSLFCIINLPKLNEPQYKQVINYKPKQIIDSVGNHKTIYIPVDTTFILKK